MCSPLRYGRSRPSVSSSRSEARCRARFPFLPSLRPRPASELVKVASVPFPVLWPLAAQLPSCRSTAARITFRLELLDLRAQGNTRRGGWLRPGVADRGSFADRGDVEVMRLDRDGLVGGGAGCGSRTPSRSRLSSSRTFPASRRKREERAPARTAAGHPGQGVGGSDRRSGRQAPGYPPGVPGAPARAGGTRPGGDRGRA